MNKFQSEKAEIPSRFLAQDLGGDRRRLVGHQAGRGGGRSGNGHLDKLFWLKQIRRSNASTGRTDVQRLGQLDKFYS